jgi:hypothetical protein
MYSKVFKIPKKAHFFYRKAHDLGISLQPRNVTLYLFLLLLSSLLHDSFMKFMQSWHVESQIYLKEHQAKWYMVEDAKDSAWKQPFLAELAVYREKVET